MDKLPSMEKDYNHEDMRVCYSNLRQSTKELIKSFSKELFKLNPKLPGVTIMAPIGKNKDDENMVHGFYIENKNYSPGEKELKKRRE